jgi:Organic Anion Transporter Polypeptide (OATP) family
MWWGGFLVCGVLILLISIPFFAFPKELKREKRKVYLDEKFKNPAAGDSAATTAPGGGKGASGQPSASPSDGPAAPPAENTYGQSLKVRFLS